LEEFFPHEQAVEAMKVFDFDGNGSLSLDEMRDSVISIYENRSHLAATLTDTRTIVGKLERLLGFCIHVLFIFFYLVIWEVHFPFI
jgi:hypothetical protein